MLIEVKVPVLSESITEGTLGKWHKKVGEFVRRDENLIDLETDKVVLEIGAPQDGVLAEIRKSDGAVVKSSEVIAVVDTAQTMPHETPPLVAASPQAVAQEMSPAVRKMVAEHRLDATQIAGTGRGGRVTKEDVLHHLEKSVAAEEKTPSAPVTTPAAGRVEQRVPMTRLRARIAERLVQAQHTAAMLTTFNEIDMQPVMDLRSHYQQDFQKKYNVKLGFMSFFIKAAVEALKQFPVINASADGNDILYHGYYDIGVAVSTERGLVVPIIRDADTRSFADLELRVTEYAQKARDGKLSVEDLTGGTFSITNGGIFGSLLSTPILNPPQSAILGMHKIEERAVVVEGQIVIRPMMYLALSYDHRIVDGQEAVRFLVAIKEALEDPARMLLQV
ncbi:MAG: 2-oxoglutarate dehydrogenase complex dihydrolipoyllysine-residue succinyltransferase [Gammaproteobacteria bacterium]|nr:2-oxoglutarate dehydrogenase complex dihydrolipoyllysine-residue succinyltransferase [Gammaproteobacteria bacterium]